MESSLKNMVLTLFAITFVSAGLLSVVYSMTKGPIEESKMAKTTEALKGVLPEFDNEPTQDTVTFSIDNMPIKVYTGRKGGVPVGYAVETMTKQGFSGEIRMMVGFLANGEIRNIEVLEHNETPGLGSKMADTDNVLLLSFAGKNASDIVMKVTKDGGDVDVITASTISSRAYADAVDRAYKAFQAVTEGAEVEVEKPVDLYATVFDEAAGKPAVAVTETSYGGKNYNIHTATVDGKITGYAVEAAAEGFVTEIILVVGFLPDGTIKDIVVTEQEESDAYGGIIRKQDNPIANSLRGKNINNLKLQFAGEGGDVDAISGATITSEAYLEAVQKAAAVFGTINKGGAE